MSERDLPRRLAGLSGAACAFTCALGFDPGDGSARVALLVRAALVGLALTAAAVAMPRRWGRAGGWWALALANAFALADVFGLLSPRASLIGVEVVPILGAFPILFALAQTGVLVAAAFADRRRRATPPVDGPARRRPRSRAVDAPRATLRSPDRSGGRVTSAFGVGFQ